MNDFKCTTKDPVAAWVSFLSMFSVLYLAMLVVLVLRLHSFFRKNIGFPKSSFLSRYFFCFLLFYKFVTMLVQALGYNGTLSVRVIKPMILVLPSYILASSYSFIMYSWTLICVHYSCNEFRELMTRRKRIITAFNITIYTFFVVLYFMYFLADVQIYSRWEIILSFVRDGVLLVGFISNVFSMVKALRVPCVCNVGDPASYVFTLMMVQIVILVVRMCARITYFVILKDEPKECSETCLIMFLMSEIIAHILPTGFIVIADNVKAVPDDVTDATSDIFNN